MESNFGDERGNVLATRRERQARARSRDRALADLAAEQRGVVSRFQLFELGFDDAWIKTHKESRIFSVGPSVYAVGHRGLSRRGRGNAALLHGGPKAGLSFVSSGRVWELESNTGDGDIHISLTTRSDIAPMRGVVIHRPRNLRPQDLVMHRGLRVTTPERTLQDLLPERDVPQISRMLEQMVTVLDRSPDDLHTWGHGLRGVTGRDKLLLALDHVAGPAVIRSEFEALFRSVCQMGGLPIAATNFRLGRWEVDAVFPDERVAVELDSYRWHGGRWQFHRDRRKGLDISRAGFELLRVSWPQLKHHPAEVIDAIRYALDRGRLRLGRH